MVKVVEFIWHIASQIEYWKRENTKVVLLVLYWKHKNFLNIVGGYSTFLVKFLMEVHGI